MQDYVVQRNGGYYLTDSRVALDSIVSAFQRGAAPETILRSFPSIGSLVKVYGSLTFYLENKDQVDRYMKEQEALAEALTANQPQLPDSLMERIRMAREGAPTGTS